MKALEIKISTAFNLVFTRNIILSCFLSFYLLIDLYFLIPAVIARVFIPIAKVEIETHPGTDVELIFRTNFFKLLTNHLNLLYFFNENFLCFIYVFNLDS